MAARALVHCQRYALRQMFNYYYYIPNSLFMHCEMVIRLTFVPFAVKAAHIFVHELDGENVPMHFICSPF